MVEKMYGLKDVWYKRPIAYLLLHTTIAGFRCTVKHCNCTCVLLIFYTATPYTAHLQDHIKHFFYSTVFSAFGISGIYSFRSSRGKSILQCEKYPAAAGRMACGLFHVAISRIMMAARFGSLQDGQPIEQKQEHKRLIVDEFATCLQNLNSDVSIIPTSPSRSG